VSAGTSEKVVSLLKERTSSKFKSLVVLLMIKQCVLGLATVAINSFLCLLPLGPSHEY
jgi:hypothetical protein